MVYKSLNFDKSNSSHVLLTSTDLNSEGLYGCEVSGEAPSFSTAKSEDEMRIYGKGSADVYREVPGKDIGPLPPFA
ncbi:ig-like domain-containing protein [Caerostris extrusa]|uniref:Ig-like domain-containing protein n=1 Tax=Caerostris extrusa TaxID=172846 RepID=A0AAV4QK28_CAEEX|nr:ig-like domain-containing protein [Caerostris extrusa]